MERSNVWILKLSGLALVTFGVSSMTTLFLERSEPTPSTEDSARDADLKLSKVGYDLGDSLRQNSRHSATVVLTNAGADRIEILRFDADCGCTAILASRRNLRPGDSAEAGATVTIGRNRGVFRRRCTVIYRHENESKERQKTFFLSGRVVPEFEVSDTLLSFSRSTAKSQAVFFEARAGVQLNVAVTGVSAHGLSAVRVADSGDGRQQIVVAYDPREYRGTGGAAQVLVSTGNPVEPDFALQVLIH